MGQIETPALLAFEEDLRSRTSLDWLRAHTSFLKPLHGYDGTLIWEPSRLSYKGVNVKTGEPFECILAKDEIEQVYYGFDEVFTVFEVRSLGLIWKPLRLTINKGNVNTNVYLIINFQWGFSDNKQWFELLKQWLA